MRFYIALASLLLMTTANALGQEPKSEHAKAKPPVCTNTGKFDSSCNPFGKAAVAHAIDNTCAITGDASGDGDKAQDRLKNNLCVNSPARVITIKELTALQSDVDATGVSYGNEHQSHGGGPPADRSTLFTKLPPDSAKEGDLVSFIGYIVEVKPGSSETVDCHCTEKDAIDVHIAVADHLLNLQTEPAKATPAQKHQVTVKNDAQLCTNSFVVETIPHKRPAALEQTAIEPLRNKKIVKITGPLLFDASHKPCDGKTPGNGDPARVTVFEIHPVYDIEVCSESAMTQCTASSNNWKSVLQK
jgi:hypothetical protein